MNGISANQRYRGQVLDVTGKTIEIRIDAVTDLPVIDLKSSAFPGVQLRFAEGHERELTQLSKNQWLTARCICDGKTDSVQLIGCQLRGAGFIE